MIHGPGLRGYEDTKSATTFYVSRVGSEGFLPEKETFRSQPWAGELATAQSSHHGLRQPPEEPDAFRCKLSPKMMAIIAGLEVPCKDRK